MKRPTVSLALIIIIWLAFTLRLFKLSDQSLWYDEGVSWYLSQMSLADLISWTAADIQPPFYYLLIWGTTRLFGESEFALRFPSVIFGTLNVAMLAILSRLVLEDGFNSKFLSLSISSPLRPGNNPSSATRFQALITFLKDGMNASFIAACFMAAAPLLIYHSQEARMYTLLVFQACLSSYLLLCLSLKVTQNITSYNLLFSYSLVMTTALYTHYFAAFLILAHALFWLLLWFKQSDNGNFPKQGAVILLGTGLPFLPWTPVLLARLGDDPSYWPGVLKLDEIVQDVFISFAVGGKREMIVETDGLRLTWVYGLMLLLCVGLSLWRHRHRPLPIIFVLLWLIVPITLILLLSYQTPKFNPRYTMIAWPAFALLLTGGLQVLGKRLALQGIILIFIALSWGFSLRNWFFVPQFSRDDFKSIAQFIRERSGLIDPAKGPEPVLLSSGHLFPVWLYYFGPDNWAALPEMETLDINQVTDLSITTRLAEVLQDKSGVWLVTWQDEVVDPNQIIPLLLDVVGQQTDNELLIGQFWGPDLFYWHLPIDIAFPAGLPTTVTADANFGHQVRLHGLRHAAHNEQEATLFWEPLQPLTEDFVVSLRLFDTANIPWGDRQVTRPGAYLYPTQRWVPSQVVPTRQPLPWLPGTPPGQYQLEIGWLTSTGMGVDILDANGNPQRRTITIGPLHLTRPISGLDAAEFSPLATIGPLILLDYQFFSERVEAGSKVIVELIWQRQNNALPMSEVRITAWEDTSGQRWPLHSPMSIGVDIHDAIAPEQTFRTRHKLTTPHQAQPGLARLLLETPNMPSTAVVLSGLVLEPTERTFTPPTNLDIVSQRQFAAATLFDGATTLLGATLNQAPLKPGQSITLTLYWQTDRPFEADFTIFVHPLGADGSPVLNFDHAPPRPTSNWQEGEIIADPITITIPADFPPGRYPVEVGLYNTADPNYARLSLVHSSNSSNQAPSSVGQTYLILTEIEVMAP